MMKNLLIIALFCLYLTNQIYSSECDNGKYCDELRLDSCRNYLCYEFGFSNIVKIYIADGDTICDISILDGKGTCVSTTCPKSPIIKWAFDNMTNEKTKSSVKLNNNYNPLYYNLSIINDSSQTILSSSLLLIEYNDDIKEKIEELKAFMIRLWIQKDCILGCEHPYGRALTTGHEIIGHGRSWSERYRENFQHVEPIRTENLILRVMGIPFINTGANHSQIGWN